MSADDVAPRWAIRSTLIVVNDLDRSVDLYRELGPFEEILREDAVAVLGGTSIESPVLILRETRGLRSVRHGPQSLGIRSISFNVGTVSELDRIESVLRRHDLLTTRMHIAEDAADVVRGRDPDNMPLTFVCYAQDKEVGADYYRAIVSLIYSLDA